MQCQVVFGVKSEMPKNHGLGRTYLQPVSQTIFIVYVLVGFLKGPFYTGQKAVTLQTGQKRERNTLSVQIQGLSSVTVTILA